MKKGIYVLLSMFVLTSMLLGACAFALPTEAPIVTESAVEEVEEGVEEPVEELEEMEEPEEPEPVEEEEAGPVRASEDDLDAVFDGVLSNAPEGYGVLAAEDLNLLLAESPDMKLIDVRRLEELEENGIIDSGEVEQTHIALEDFIANKGEWPEDLASQVAVYCSSGHRSTMAMTMLWS